MQEAEGVGVSGGVWKDLTQICLYIRPYMMEMLLGEQIIRLFKGIIMQSVILAGCGEARAWLRTQSGWMHGRGGGVGGGVFHSNRFQNWREGWLWLIRMMLQQIFWDTGVMMRAPEAGARLLCSAAKSPQTSQCRRTRIQQACIDVQGCGAPCTITHPPRTWVFVFAINQLRVIANRDKITRFKDTYVPYCEEDQRHTEDQGQHVAEGSKSEHSWKGKRRIISPQKITILLTNI